jgi:hypothetical protein
MIKKFLTFIVVLIAFSKEASLYAQVTVTLDSTIKYQTIEGWGHGGDLFSNLSYALPLYGIDQATIDSINYQYLRFIAYDLGLTGSRMWEVGPRVDGTGMDNGDCDSIDWNKFQARPIDTLVARNAVYFKDLIHASGYRTSFYSSPTYPTFATAFKPWVLNHPGERAQQVWANALWWKNKYGIDINYDVIYNEPSSPITYQILSDDIKALGPRLLNLGLQTRSQYAEAVAPQTDWSFITPVQNDSELWKYVGRLSYHNYGTADPYRAQIRDFGKAWGIPTAQTEMANPTIEDLFNDLTLGGVTYWEVGFSGNVTLVPSAGGTSWTPSSTYFRMRQLLHYIRPGAIRIEATSGDSALRVLAFVRDGKITTVLFNTGSDKTADLSNLPPGKYGISQSQPGATAFQELGIKTVSGDGTLSVNLGASGCVTTIYPYIGTNQPPTIMSWGSNPGYFTSTTPTVSVSVKANDPENDPLTYQWSVVSQPNGSDAQFASPSSPTSNLSGLASAGMYIFKVTVSDGTHITSRKVYILGFVTNPPPILGQAGFRIAPPYGLVFTNPGDTTHANIELPTSSAMLQVGIGDLAGSDFTGRGTWTLVSQPPGANATFDDTTKYYFVSIRRPVSNMTVPGDYVFQCNVTNPGHPDLIASVICTIHPASNGPVIQTILAVPSQVFQPKDSAALSSVVTDTSGQLLRYWWVIKSSPPGTAPYFDHQGRGTTNVFGLTKPGNYIFTLRAFDDIHMATKDVTIEVKPSSGVARDDKSESYEVALYPNPVADELMVQPLIAGEKVLKVKVMNMLGGLVLEKNAMDDDPKLDLRSLPAGIYSLEIALDHTVVSKRIVKQ